MFSCFLRKIPNAHIKYDRIISVALIATTVVILICNLVNYAKDHSEKFYYVQYECTQANRLCGGWADRLKGIMSTYALSQVLNRSFLLKITQPCNFNKMLRPNKVDWDQSPTAFSTLLRIAHSYNLIRSFESVDLNHYLGTKRRFKVISVRSGIMFSDAFAKNPHLRDRINELGYANASDFKIYKQMHKWYNELFKLSPHLEKKYLQLLRLVKPNEKTFLICLQVRLGSKTKNNKSDLKFADPHSSQAFWTFVNQMFLNNTKALEDVGDKENFRIFLTTDTDRVKREASRVFGKKILVYNPEKSFHMDRDFSDLGDDCSSIESTIVDFHLQQHCDAAVVSHSGFGIMGAWNRPNVTKHFYVFTKSNQKELEKNYFMRENLEFKKINNIEEDLYFI